ncbi:MAG TPA: hypothetical protein PKH39_15110 [Woeseiaceae bacterium]|nr:hypothetical protein [Woeseiaceae bacterium]
MPTLLALPHILTVLDPIRGELVSVDAAVVVKIDVIERGCLGLVLDLPTFVSALGDSLTARFGEFVLGNCAVTIQVTAGEGRHVHAHPSF